MVDLNKTRNSGKTVSEETVIEVSKESDSSLDTPIEHSRKFRTPGFARMRTDWNGDDGIIKEKAKRVANEFLHKEFGDGFNILNWVYDQVRTPEVDQDDEIQLDENGNIIWRKNEYGIYEEDYSRLTYKERDNLLFSIATRLFEWEQKSQDIWHEAMLAKGQWEERFSIGFEEPRSGTQGDREAAGRKESAEERYFAIFVTAYSRKAEAFVNGMKNLQNILLKQLK